MICNYVYIESLTLWCAVITDLVMFCTFLVQLCLLMSDPITSRLTNKRKKKCPEWHALNPNIYLPKHVFFLNDMLAYFFPNLRCYLLFGFLSKFKAVICIKCCIAPSNFSLQNAPCIFYGIKLRKKENQRENSTL